MIKNIIYTTKNKIGESAGGALHVIGLGNGFFKAGMNVNVICPDSSLNSINFKFNVYPLACDSGNRIFRLIKFEVAKFKTIVDLLNCSEGNSAIYIRRGILHFAEYLTSYIYNAPLIIEENDKKPWASLPIKSRIIDVLFLLGTRVLYRRAKCIVVVSEGLAEFIAKGYPFISKKMLVVNNGVDEEVFFPLDRDVCRNAINAENSEAIVGYVGSLFKQRGVQYLIGAIEILRESGVSVRAIIVGDGTYRTTLQEIANKNNVSDFITFVGYQPPHSANIYINAFDCCVLADDCEKIDISLSPLKLSCYFACEKPVVAPRIPIDLPIDAHGRICMFFEPENSESLAHAIQSVLNDKDLSRLLGLNAFKYVRSNHTWTIAAATIIDAVNRD